MNYDLLFKKANEMAALRRQSGALISPDDTICVLFSGSGRIFTGTNRHETVNGRALNIHAEAEAIQSLQAAKESVIKTVLLISAMQGSPLLPCEHCLRSIVLLNPENIKCEIMMHDRAVPVTELGDFSGKVTESKNLSTSEGVRVTSQNVEEIANNSDVLMQRVNSLLSTVEEDDDEEKEDDQPKGLFGGLFRRKKK